MTMSMTAAASNGGNNVKIAVGPIQYYWPRDTVIQFYQGIATGPADIVYLGETVCSRRHELRLADWMAIAASLRDAGKEVVFSTQVLLESKADLATMKRIVLNEEFLVEANDYGAVHLVSGVSGGRPFVAGSQLNIYNLPTLEYMQNLGARRWVMPLESSRDSLAELLRPGLAIETEVFAYGRMPLAYSARCFTARHHNLPKDDCQFKCLDYPDGLLMKTRDNEHFLTLNGIQTQSALVYNLVKELDSLRDIGVRIIRVSPQARHTNDIISGFRDVLDGVKSARSALEDMAALAPDRFCDGYWHGRPGLELLTA
jgi:O2-independent ubiquinone biosynthesis protein UbiV